MKIKGYKTVCTATLYSFIKYDKASGGDLYKNLRHKKTYKKRSPSTDNRGRIKNTVSIDERPTIVDEKNT